MMAGLIAELADIDLQRLRNRPAQGAETVTADNRVKIHPCRPRRPRLLAHNAHGRQPIMPSPPSDIKNDRVYRAVYALSAKI